MRVFPAAELQVSPWWKICMVHPRVHHVWESLCLCPVPQAKNTCGTKRRWTLNVFTIPFSSLHCGYPGHWNFLLKQFSNLHTGPVLALPQSWQYHQCVHPYPTGVVNVLLFTGVDREHTYMQHNIATRFCSRPLTMRNWDRKKMRLATSPGISNYMVQIWTFRLSCRDICPRMMLEHISSTVY